MPLLSDLSAEVPLYFGTHDEEVRLWGFAERMESIMFKAKNKNSIMKKTSGTRKAIMRKTKKSARVQTMALKSKGKSHKK